MVKLSSFIIGCILISMFVATMGSFMADVSDNSNVDYDSSAYGEDSPYFKLAELSNTTETLEDKALGVKEKTGAVDVLGSFITGGYETMKIGWQSYGVFGAMLNAAVGVYGLPTYWKMGLTLIVFILLIMGVIISALVKWRI